MVLSVSTIPAADYFINRDPWLRRLGGREAGKRISEQLYECCPPILRGRPIYDRLPGAAEAYNKDSNTFIAQGTIILPELQTIISDAEDVYFRERFPEEYQQRDYITGSQLGPGSVAALFEDSKLALKQGDSIVNRTILIRSGIFLWADDIVRDDTDISKQTIEFPGMVVTLPRNGSGWFWMDGNGNLNVTEALPDGAANLSANIWCNPAADATNEPSCVRRITVFQRDENLIDAFDVGETGLEPSWPPTEECTVATFNEVSLLYRYIVTEGVLTTWEDYRRFNRTFDLPVARWLMDYFDNILQEKREQIDTFVDDSLNPDTIGFNFIGCETELRQNYKIQTFDQILDAWDFGLINEQTLDNLFSFLSVQELAELRDYDDLTHEWLDWLAQHFGFQDNGSLAENVWHSGSQFDGVDDGQVFYTIAEKRAILRNALGQDPFQTLVDAGTFVEDFPIWGIFEDLWGFTEVFWNGAAQIPSGETEFVFTRFPFTTYNRLKPETWHGLMKAKGTIQGLYFMFDVLGLHGYACTQGEPRFFDTAADFETPLIPLKPVNSAVIDTIKTLDNDGNIVESLDEFGQKQFRIGNYAQTGYVQTGLTSFSKDYDRKLVVRAPFSWGRNSQKWLRLQEIAESWVNDGQLVTGYYHFITGQSAANEPVWLPEICTACEYVVTTELFETSSFYGSDDENISSEFSWIQNMVGADNWNNIGFERGSNLAYNLTTYPTYVEDRTILAIYNDGINDSEPRRDNASNEFPIIASYDNGLTFQPITTNYDNANAVSPIKFANRLRHVSGNTFLVSDDIILFSQDAGVNWFEFDTQGTSGKFLDIFPDPDTRRLIVLTDESIFHKFDYENTFSKYQDLILEGGETVSDAILRNIDDAITVSYVTQSGADIRHRIVGTQINGDNIFVINDLGNFDIDANVGIIKLRGSNVNVPENYNHFYFYSDGTNEFLWTLESLREFRDESAIFSQIYAQIILDFPDYSGGTFETTDVTYNTQNGRLEYLITINDGTLPSFGAIYSTTSAFNDIVKERSNIALIDNETKTGDFIIKRLQTPDIDAAPVEENIEFVNTEKVVKMYGPPKIYGYDPVDFFEITIPCIDTTHNTYPTTFFSGEEDKRDAVAINSTQYLTGFNYIDFELPVSQDDYEFVVTNEDITNPITTPEFEPSDNTWSILQASCITAPFEVKSTNLPIVGNYNEINEVDNVNIQMRGTTITDEKDIFFRLKPSFGYYINNYYQSGSTWENFKTITFSDHIPPDVNFSLVNNIEIADIFVMSPHESLLGAGIFVIDSAPTSMDVSVPAIDALGENVNLVITVNYKVGTSLLKTIAFRIHFEPSFGGP